MDCALSSTIVTDDMIKDKAMTIARGYHLTGGRNKFVCSRTWIRSLKSRYGIVNGCFMDYSASISRKRDQALGYWLVQLPRRSVPELALAFKAARSIQSAPTPLLLSAGDTLETNLSDQERKIESSPSGDVPPIPASSATPTVSAAEQSSPDIILDVDSADLLPVSSVSRIEEYDTDIMCMPDNGLGTCRTLPDQSVSTPDGPHMSNTFFPSDPASASTQLPLTALDPSAFHYDPSLNRITFLNPDRLEDLPLDHFLPTDDVPLLDQGLSTDQFPPLDQIVSPASGPGLPTNQSHALGIYGDDPFLALLTDTDSMSSLLPDPSADCTSLFFPVSHDSVAPGFEPAGADMTSFVPQLMFDGLDVSTFHTMDLTGSGQAEFNAAMLDSWSAITESTM
ncbi:uncharacterized protein C8Q71DRAFT_547732 [Rhodofomes roseus]|uniref:HTH CENPB-type domain-containing protein n=1 Tax=Rhodofomes roseus TaxID=34475 RepID=A0ABQ8KHS8_9APHY|nr:uncharacterized protein C8Q71DRAFT_547732 [Rhodofomes roseus]KAH9837542.1 hypothetical protein C8Q71DRAFT_547732 [Rhodofomes roseus]